MKRKKAHTDFKAKTPKVVSVVSPVSEAFAREESGNESDVSEDENELPSAKVNELMIPTCMRVHQPRGHRAAIALNAIVLGKSAFRGGTGRRG